MLWARPAAGLLLALLFTGTLADEESCSGRCTEGFNSNKKCQCDDLCSYYQSCCSDYIATCKPQVTRGDAFALPEDEYGDFPDRNANTSNIPDDPIEQEILPDPTEVPEGQEETTSSSNIPGMEVPNEEEEEEPCSGKPFDAFTDLKNGSFFAFRGKYCYELDEKSVLPGYPKLIRDVWGIEGPVDAAFTRINCQGKTYLFQGSQYWRFEDGILDEGYPRNISEGFQNIPDDLDAALALPARSFSGRERVYFFKGKKYWQYEFQTQPSREECEGSSPSAVFEHYALMQRDSWEDIFQLLFWDSRGGGASRPQYINRNWRGVPGRVDAAVAGRIYLSARSPTRSAWTQKRKARRNRRRYRLRNRSRSRSSGSRWMLPFFLDPESEEEEDDWFVPSGCQPIQSVYFFVGDKYYRVNLQTRRVDKVKPPYPRPIAPYWLGCPASDT
ncbi:vitronectin [Ornithorhynchus anatinus]|uniref:Vitronectin n=1 Tax=Ornithorhynchus anatinus TaxID=9258 RepID=F7GA06_ORNAN|nr:vitronectin [Ornithorhynchus anatinus]